MVYAYRPHERLLSAFDQIFRGKVYKHRDQSLGNWVAAHLYEDLLAVAKSPKLAGRLADGTCVRNRDIKVIGGAGRRGDGALGQLIPGALPTSEKGFAVQRGPVGQVEIGAETKILAKAMIKQIDRVIGDLNRQVQEFNRTGGRPLCIALVGVNHADSYISFEGTRSFPTDGGKNKHPIQEAEKAIGRLAAVTGYDEVLILPFKASNADPYRFEWLAFETTRQLYAALLVRISNAYQSRF